MIEISGGSDKQPTGRAINVACRLLEESNIPLLCTNFVKLLRLNSRLVDSEYFVRHWSFLYELGRTKTYEKQTTGIRNFNFKDFVANEVIPLPPLAEQRAIAAYLDRETAKIDALIARTEQLNALLGEKRTALHSHVVTKGLDPAVELKDSGVEWLGEIPQHWTLATVRAICECRGGFGFPIIFQGKPEGEYPFFKVSDMNLQGNEKVMRTANNYIDSSDLDAIKAKVTRKGATIFPKIGAAIHTNKKRILSTEAVVDNNVMCVWVRDAKVCSDEYLYLCFQAIHLSELAQLGTVPTISTTRLYSHAIPLPPRAEQRAIAEHLDRETARIDALSAKNNQLIVLLREKRTALISAAVTGKIDLRNEA